MRREEILLLKGFLVISLYQNPSFSPLFVSNAGFISGGLVFFSFFFSKETCNGVSEHLHKRVVGWQPARWHVCIFRAL